MSESDSIRGPVWLDEAMKLAENYARAWQHDVNGEYLVKDQATKAKAVLRAFLSGVELAERERCAARCDAVAAHDLMMSPKQVAEYLAAAIRATP